MNLDEAVSLWLDELALNGASTYTLSNYKRALGEAGTTLELRHGDGLDIKSVTRDDVVAVLAAFASRPDKRSGEVVARSAGSVHSFYGALRSFFSWCVETEKLDANPVARVKAPKVGKRVPKALAQADCERLLAVADESKTPERDRLALLLTMTMGLRLGELSRLTPASFSPSVASPEHLRVLGKGNKERVVPVTPAVEEALGAYLAVRAQQLAAGSACASTLFLARSPKAGSLDVSRDNLSEVFDRLMKAADLKEPGRRVHALRHSFATHVLAAGGDILTVSELLGHASVATTQIYLSVAPERLAAAVEANPLARGRASRSE